MSKIEIPKSNMMFKLSGKESKLPKFKEGQEVIVTDGKPFSGNSPMIIKSMVVVETERNVYYQYKIAPIDNAYEFAWVWERDIVAKDPKIIELKKRLKIR